MTSTRQRAGSAQTNLCPVSEEAAQQRTEDKSQALCTDEAVHTSLNCDDEIDFICEDNVDGILELDHLDETFTLIKELFPGKADDVIIPVIEDAHGDPIVAANILFDDSSKNIESDSQRMMAHPNPCQNQDNFPSVSHSNVNHPATFINQTISTLDGDNTSMVQAQETLRKQEMNFDSLEEFLQSKQKLFKESKVSDRLRIMIRRRKIWSDTMEKFTMFINKADFDLCRQLDIKFIGEDAIDQGGVSREFFSCVFEAASQKIMVGNSENNYNTFIHDTTALESRNYYFYGVLVGLALLHGCPGPHNWCPSLSQYILKQECQFSPCQVPDFGVQQKLIAINKCTSDEEMGAIMADFPERFDAGYNKGNVSLQDRDDMVNKVIRHHVISACHEEIHQVITGLDNLGMLKFLTKFPNAAMKELVPSSDLTPETILHFFNVVYSPEGSNHKMKEEDVMYNLSNFLELVEQGEVSGVQVLDLDTEECKTVTLSLNDVLQFITGARYFCPAVQQGEVEFDHEAPEGKRLEVSTCSFRLLMPCNKRYTESSIAFTNNVTEDIVSSPGFGKV